MYLIFPPRNTRNHKKIYQFSFIFIFLDILFMQIYIFFVFKCLHLLSGFFCSFNWNVYFTLILANISPTSYHAMCICRCVCAVHVSIKAIIGKGHRKKSRRKLSYEKEEDFFSRLANKISMRENLIEVKKVQAMAQDTATI